MVQRYPSLKDQVSPENWQTGKTARDIDTREEEIYFKSRFLSCDCKILSGPVLLDEFVEWYQQQLSKTTEVSVTI